jgi:hypothetical protein
MENHPSHAPLKRYRLIVCGVFAKEIASLRSRIPETVALDEVWLELGLHRDPAHLNRLLREAVAAAENGNTPLDAILLGYGLCSRGTEGISSGRFRIVIPRAHDCITLFLGSKERYLAEFNRTPGTYWFSPGYLESGGEPGMSEKYPGIHREYEARYEEYLARFGEDEARYIIERQEQAWIRNYTRGAYVGGALANDRLREKARRFCESRDWAFEEVAGDQGLLLDLISGNWDESRFLVLEPGEVLTAGGEEEVVRAGNADGSDSPSAHATGAPQTGSAGTSPSGGESPGK